MKIDVFPFGNERGGTISCSFEKRQKERYSRKVKMKKKIASMIMNATKAYPTNEEDVSRDNETKSILKMIDRRRLTKKKRVPN